MPPLKLSEFLNVVKTKKSKTPFVMTGRASLAKFFIGAEVPGVLLQGKEHPDTPPISGLVQFNNTMNFVVEADKAEATKALKEAYGAGGVKWEAVQITAHMEDVKPLDDLQKHKLQVLNPHGPQNGAYKVPLLLEEQQVAEIVKGLPPGTQIQRVDAGWILLNTPVGASAPNQKPGTVAKPLDKLQMHKLKVLNPGGPRNGVYNVPLLLDDAQIAELLKTLPAGTHIARVDAQAITLDTPIPEVEYQTAGGETKVAAKLRADLDALSTTVATLQSSCPWAAVTLENMCKEVKGNANHKPALAAQNLQRLRDYLKTGFKTDLVKKQLSAYLSDYTLAKKNAGPNAAALEQIYRDCDKNKETNPDEAIRKLAELRMKVDELVARPTKDVAKDLLGLQADLKRVKELAPGAAADLDQKQEALKHAVLSNDSVLATRLHKDFVNELARVRSLASAEEIKQSVVKKIFLAKDETGRTVLPMTVYKDPAFIKRMAQETFQSEATIEEYLDVAMNEVHSATTKLLPNGYARPMKLSNTVNGLLPAESRPTLTAQEAKALQDYTSMFTTKNGSLINNPLREGKTPAPPHDKTYALLQAAFKKAKPLSTPVDVTRDYTFAADKVEGFMKQFRVALQNKSEVVMAGFISSGAGGRPAGFVGNVVLFIKAKQGLDATPYTEVPQEKELVLNHNSRFTVIDIKELGEEYQVRLEQVIS